jgi:hypothetical protein
VLLACVFASMIALAPQDGAANAKLPADFVPALNYAERPVEFWIDELEQTQGRSSRAVWCLYYHDDRSPRVIDALKRWLRRWVHAELDTPRVIDTVLNEWGVEFEPLTIEEFLATEGETQGEPITLEAHANQPWQPRYRPVDLRLYGDSSVLLQSVLDEARNATAREIVERGKIGDASTWECNLGRYTDWSEHALQAACTLIVRREHIPKVLQALIEHSEAAWWQLGSGDLGPSFLLRKLLPWAQEQVGSGLAEAVGAELDHARDASEQLRWLKYLATLNSGPYWPQIDVRGALSSVVARLDQPGEVRAEAWGVLNRIAGIKQATGGLPDKDYHNEWLSRPYDDAELEEALAHALAPRLAAAIASDSDFVPTLEWIQVTGLHSQLVRDACTPMLLEVAHRDDEFGLSALRILCHFGRTDDFVKQRYVEWLSRWRAFDDAGIERVPCLREHNEATLAALRSVFARAEHKASFEDRLACAGLTDGYVEAMAQQMLEEIARVGAGYDALVHEGFRGILTVAPNDERVVKVQKLALTIAAKRAHAIDWSKDARDYAALLRDDDMAGTFGDFMPHMRAGFGNAISLKLATPEFIEAALRIVEAGGWPRYDRHVDYACDLLSLCELDPQQRGRFYYADKGRRLSQGLPLPTIDSSVPRANLAPSTVEDVVPIAREYLYGGEWSWLRPLLLVARLVPRDEAYLLATLEHGTADARAFAVKLVLEAKLDTPAIRAVVAKLSDDCDRKTRELARKVRRERDWK